MGTANHHMVAVFGTGLVGGAICDELEKSNARLWEENRIDWNSSESVELAALKVCETAYSARMPAGKCTRLSVVWAAGGGGFYSSEASHISEFNHFKRVLAIGERLRSLQFNAQSCFFLVSSAGGLYEGRRNVGPDCLPSPLRDYGRYKLLQEDELERATGFHSCIVYRPSTVYGHSPKGRVGLIAALLTNGIRHRVSHISGSSTTLRDYVLNTDLGRFIATEILAQSKQSGFTRKFLVSGKPCSILEVSRVAEELLGRKLYFTFALGPQNALHNTYHPSAVAEGWRSASLREGIQSVLRGMMGMPNSNGRI
jgi:UDP-glucose 4-epimerase